MAVGAWAAAAKPIRLPGNLCAGLSVLCQLLSIAAIETDGIVIAFRSLSEAPLHHDPDFFFQAHSVLL
jgi:hypothetical protein